MQSSGRQIHCLLQCAGTPTRTAISLYLQGHIYRIGSSWCTFIVFRGFRPWLYHKPTVDSFARHYETGMALSDHCHLDALLVGRFPSKSSVRPLVLQGPAILCLINPHQRCGCSDSPFARIVFLYCRVQEWIGRGGHQTQTASCPSQRDTFSVVEKYVKIC